MSTSGAPRPAGGYGTVIDSRRLWAGGAATACVAALVALIGVLLFNSVLDVKLVQHPLLLTLTGSLAVNYAVTAFVAPDAKTAPFPARQGKKTAPVSRGRRNRSVRESGYRLATRGRRARLRRSAPR